MSIGMRRIGRYFWDATRGVREKILAKLRAHIARALAENFSQLTEHVESLTRVGADLATGIRAAEREHREAQLRHQQAQANAEASAQVAAQRFQAAEEHYRETITRYEQTLADYQQKVGAYHQTVSESNLLAEGVIREMVRLQQQVDELAEAVDLVNDAIHPETEAAPVTLKYRAAA